MAHIHFHERSRSNWTPAAYDTNETAQIFNVAAGDLIGAAFARIRTGFDGTSPSASLGDGDSVNRFMTTTNMGVATTGLKRGTGAGLTEVPGYLYTAADTIDITFTAATGSPTVGAMDVWVWLTRADPH